MNTGNITYYAVDGLGSIVAEVQGGTITGGVQYGPFGTTTANPRRFPYTGRELDPGGIYYYRARYYHPNIGRFLSEDTGWEGARGETFGLGSANLYYYVGNNPIRRTDPSGNDWIDKIPNPIPFIPLVKCIYYQKQCAGDSACCVKQINLSKMSDDAIAAIGTDLGAGPIYKLCFAQQTSCKKMVYFCTIAGSKSYNKTPGAKGAGQW